MERRGPLVKVCRWKQYDGGRSEVESALLLLVGHFRVFFRIRGEKICVVGFACQRDSGNANAGAVTVYSVRYHSTGPHKLSLALTGSTCLTETITDHPMVFFFFVVLKMEQKSMS